MTDFVDETTADIRLTLDGILGGSIPEAAWLQSCLPIRLGGLGVQNPSLTYYAAFFSSGLAECSGAYSPNGEQALPNEALRAVAEKLSGQIGPDQILITCSSEGALPPAGQILQHELYKQKYWSDKVHTQVQQDLYVSAPLRDKLRLQSEKAAHAGAWIGAVPNDNLGFRFGNAEHQLLLSFHLGLPILPDAAAGAPCDDCGQPLDVYGDHLVSCRLGGAWDRHNKVGSTIASIATSAGLNVQREVQIHGKQRPADLLLTNFVNGQDVAVDLTVIHSVLPSRPWEPHKLAVDQAEATKTAKYQECCTTAGVHFFPLGMDAFGAFGTQGSDLLGKLFHKYAGRVAVGDEQRFPGQFQRECWQRVSVALRRGVAAQLCRALTQLGGTVAPPFPAGEQ